MHVMIDGQWKDGFLDYHSESDEYLVESIVWKNLERLQGLYYERSKNPWTIWNYLWSVGPRQTLRKVLSRSQEGYRNEKYVACGIGKVREAPVNNSSLNGQMVVFIATCHPSLAERLVIPKELLKTVDQKALSFLPEKGNLLYHTELEDQENWWQSIRAWNKDSGIVLSASECDVLLDHALNTLKCTNWKGKNALKIEKGCSVVVRSRESPYIYAETRYTPRDIRRKSAVLFGYGNYAKNVILPNIRKYLDVSCIHEIDPLQIPFNRKYIWDTSPTARMDEKYNVFLIAGFHHTHVSLAIRALQQDADVVIEKPIAVSRDQLMSLLEAMRLSNGKVFCCFHKRYLSFNSLALEDLHLQPGEPVSYYCVVYHEPLPRYHWYRWPNSKGRLVTDGCHWIDHFLFLNNYAKAVSYSLVVAPDQNTVNCSISLDNGAFFTMAMTHGGSDRIGSQEYVELQANERTVRITNETSYIAEEKRRIIRKKKVRKMQSYERMYREISQKIILGVAGDSITSIKSAAELAIQLQEYNLPLE